MDEGVKLQFPEFNLEIVVPLYAQRLCIPE
jgi:hypothetical protein